MAILAVMRYGTVLLRAVLVLNSENSGAVPYSVLAAYLNFNGILLRLSCRGRESMRFQRDGL